MEIGEARHAQRCHCGKLARMQTSWTTSNPRRRFLVYPKSKIVWKIEMNHMFEKLELLEMVGIKKSELLEMVRIEKLELLEMVGIEKLELLEMAGIKKPGLLEMPGIEKDLGNPTLGTTCLFPLP
ncbi:unnamed protein product [Prunus brigantina]